MRYFALSLSTLAQEDMNFSYDFYENQSQNLGTHFYDTLISDLDALRFYAGIHQRVFGYYRMITKRFPYAIYYDIEEDLVVVHAVLHTRMDMRLVEQRLRP